MRVAISADELVAFSRAIDAVPEVLRTEMRSATQAVVADGVALAQEYAPVMDGTLRNSIQPISSSMDGLSGEFGTSAIHAFQREYGGTITPKKGRFLVWPDPSGATRTVTRGKNKGQTRPVLIYARSVTQEGSFYMRSAFQQLSPRAYLAYQMAVNRAIAAAGAW